MIELPDRYLLEPQDISGQDALPADVLPLCRVRFSSAEDDLLVRPKESEASTIVVEGDSAAIPPLFVRIVTHSLYYASEGPVKPSPIVRSTPTYKEA